MKPHAEIIAKTTVDFNQLLTIAKAGFGRSLSKSLDERKKESNTISGYLVLLAEMKNPNSDPIKVLKNAGNLLQHVFYSFLVGSDNPTVFEVLEQTSLKVHNAECVNGLNLSIVSGNLEEWRSAIINSCSDQAGYHLRILFDKILLCFEQEGLGRLWADYKKKELPDKTFKLIENR